MTIGQWIVLSVSHIFVMLTSFLFGALAMREHCRPGDRAVTPIGRWLERRRHDDETRVVNALGPFATVCWSHTPQIKARAALRWGRLYLALGRLERAGLVEAKWDDNEQPPPKHRRRLYRLARLDPLPALTDAQRDASRSAVIHVAETLARCAPGTHRIRGPMDAVGLAREATAALLILPAGRRLAAQILADDELLAGVVADAGGGEVRITVDRTTDSYPVVGTRVRLTPRP